MISCVSIARFALAGLLPVSAQANEALKLLAQEADSSQSIYEEAADLATSRKNLKVEEEKFAPLDPYLAERWRNELEPKFPIQAASETRVAPRGLFEYQHQDRSIGEGTKLSRARVGVAVETVYGIELQADALLSSSGKYEGWETLKGSVPVGQLARLHVGKFPPPFSTEYSRDAAIRWFPTLSPFAAQLAPASTSGAMFEGRGKKGDWKIGWFGSDADRSMPSFDGKGAILVSLAQSNNKGGEKGSPQPHFQRWHLDYLYNMEGSRSETIPQGYRHLVSLGSQYSAGGFDFFTELLAAKGSGNTAYGVTAAGRYWLLQDAISLVARYQYARSQNPGGIVSYWGIPDTGSDATFPTDFPATTVGGQLSSFYSGLNVHFDDDNFIIGTGLEYRSVSEIGEENESLSSWGWTTFARYAF
jgi:hypothetical protein